jgi:hypothetical protein
MSRKGKHRRGRGQSVGEERPDRHDATRRRTRHERRHNSRYGSRSAGAPWKRFALPGGAIVLLVLAFMIHHAVSASGEESFDGERALADTKTQCDFGARIPGTEPHVKTRDWIVAEIEKIGLVAWLQPFEAHLALIEKDAPAWNIWAMPKAVAEARERGETPEGPFIVIGAHWDTRPLADDEPPGRPQLPVTGANDGAAAVAMGLELARAIEGTPLADRVILGFWDAEDAGTSGSDATWCIGSQYAAANWKEQTPFLGKMKLGINLDMVAGRGLQLEREGNSLDEQPGAMRRLWSIGMRRAPNMFLNRDGNYYTDDHMSFIDVGLPFIDLIGLPHYRYWHKVGDTPDKCDPATMATLGNVLIEFVRGEIG